MNAELLIGGFLIALALGVFLSLIASDVRRRRVTMRRKWYERRLHAAMDRVHAMKTEMEPPLDGVGEFGHVATLNTRKGAPAFSAPRSVESKAPSPESKPRSPESKASEPADQPAEAVQ